jgi:hypothetical protein
MKMPVFAIGATALLAVSLAISSPATAHMKRHHHAGDAHGSPWITKGKAARVRYGGKPGLGYWRRGPEKGYGFRFSSYKGDPFGSDDYWDGDRCYYVLHRNHCVVNKIFNGFE